MQVKQGDIYYANLNPFIGSEQGGIRPVLVIQGDVGNRYSSTVIIACVTSKHKAEIPTHFEISGYGLRERSIVLLEQIRTIDTSRLRERIGHVPPEVMVQIWERLDISFGRVTKDEGGKADMNKLIPIEYKSQRVLSTKILALKFGTDEKNIQMNFSNNECRFITGKHYYKLDGEELKEFKRSLPNEIGEPLKFVPSLILWTDRGAARHAKILETDEAWQIYEELEETYFKVKENKIDVSRLSPELQMVQHLLNAAAKLEAKVEKLEATTQTIKDTIITQPDNWREDLNRMFNKIALALGDDKFRDLRNESYKLLESRAHVDLKRRLKFYKDRLDDLGKSKTVINSANRLDVIEQDPKLREIYATIIKEYSIKYCT